MSVSKKYQLDESFTVPGLQAIPYTKYTHSADPLFSESFQNILRSRKQRRDQRSSSDLFTVS